MKRKAKRRSDGQVLLTSADIRRYEADIAKNIKIRDAANAVIAENRRLLEAANLFASRVKKARKAPAKAERRAAAKAAEATPPPPPPPAAPSRLPRGGGSYTIIKEVLRANPHGLPATELRREAAQHPDAPVSIREHWQYIYSVLDTLKKRGEVTKEGGKWKIAPPQVPERAGVH